MTLRSKNVSMGLLGIFGLPASFAGCCCFSFFVSGMPSQSSLRDASSPKVGAIGKPGHFSLDA